MNKEDFVKKLKHTDVERELMQAYEDKQGVESWGPTVSETLQECKRLGLTDKEIIEYLRMDPKHRDHVRR